MGQDRMKHRGGLIKYLNIHGCGGGAEQQRVHNVLIDTIGSLCTSTGEKRLTTRYPNKNTKIH